MNTFQQVWANWTRHPFGQPEVSEHAWINELNQAVFRRLENILPPNVKVRAVTTPAFIYYTEAAGGYGVEQHAGTVVSYRVKLPKASTFEERVEGALNELHNLFRGYGTVFLYSPIVPLGSHNVDGSLNRDMMVIRLFRTGETIDVEKAGAENG